MAYRSKTYKEQAHADGIWSVAFGANNRFMTGSVDATVKVWQVDTAQAGGQADSISLVNDFAGHRLGVISVDVDPSGTLGCSSSMDSCIRVWDLEKGKTVRVMEAPPVDAWTVSFSPDGKNIATGSQTGNVNIFDIETGKVQQSLDTQRKAFVMCVRYSPCGRYLACGTQDGSVSVFDISTSRLLHNMGGGAQDGDAQRLNIAGSGHSMTVRSVAFTRDSQRLISCSDDKHINIYDISSGNLIKSLSGHNSFVFDLAVSPDGQHFASCSADRQVKIWELSTMECIHSFQSEHSDQVWGVAYNHDGSLLASVGDDMTIRIYDIPLDQSK